jgi:hypothetical protein
VPGPSHLGCVIAEVLRGPAPIRLLQAVFGIPAISVLSSSLLFLGPATCNHLRLVPSGKRAGFPTLDQIIDQHLQAIGGRAAYPNGRDAFDRSM